MSLQDTLLTVAQIVFSGHTIVIGSAVSFAGLTIWSNRWVERFTIKSETRILGAVNECRAQNETLIKQGEQLRQEQQQIKKALAQIVQRLDEQQEN